MARRTTLWLIYVCFNLCNFAGCCLPRWFDDTSFVCVCNSGYCDSAPNVNSLRPGRAVLITSSQIDARFQTQRLFFNVNPCPAANATVTIDGSLRYQSIIGFGGAFSDSAGINMAQLSYGVQDYLLGSYFSKNGIEYGMARVPMGGTDFSTRAYSYDDSPGDVHLSNFSLQEEDLLFKIPFIQRAKRMSSKPIKLFSSPWSAPVWMKTNGQFNGKGQLIDAYYQIWANYFVRFFEEYMRYGVEFWGLTAQNEPIEGNIPGHPFNTMGWTGDTQGLFIGQNLGPTLESNGFENVKIMIFDDNRIGLVDWVKAAFARENAMKYTSGIGIHWYFDAVATPQDLLSIHGDYQDKFVLATEACAGYSFFSSSPVALGSWMHLEQYACNIIEDLNNWVTGWIDWNIALDMSGGPNWAGGSCNSPIIVNGSANEFYKQPTYYAMGHFSKYIPEGSWRIGIQITDSELYGTAVLRPDGMRAVVLLNRSDRCKTIQLQDTDRGTLQLLSPARSIQTVIYG